MRRVWWQKQLMGLNLSAFASALRWFLLVLLQIILHFFHLSGFSQVLLFLPFSSSCLVPPILTYFILSCYTLFSPSFCSSSHLVLACVWFQLFTPSPHALFFASLTSDWPSSYLYLSFFFLSHLLSSPSFTHVPDHALLIFLLRNSVWSVQSSWCTHRHTKANAHEEQWTWNTNNMTNHPAYTT